MRYFILSIIMVMLFGVSGFALSGDEILQKAEDLLSSFKDTEGTADLILANSDGSGREERSVQMWMSGKEKRLIKFLSPAGVRGIGLLVLSDKEMYVYLPAQRRVRRISCAARNEDFQGTDFSYDEMASYEYTRDYTAKIISEDDKLYTLELTRKEGSEMRYDKTIMTVRKKDFIPQRLEMYEGGTLIKVMTMHKVETFEGKYTIPTHVKMENVQKAHYTEMILRELKFDQGLENKDIFSQRFLGRPPGR